MMCQRCGEPKEKASPTYCPACRLLIRRLWQGAKAPRVILPTADIPRPKKTDHHIKGCRL